MVSIVVAVLAIAAALGWWYWSSMQPDAEMPTGTATETAPEESVNGIAADSSVTANKLVGNWESKDDAKFTREFTAQGTVTDRYDGSLESTISGKWSFVADPSKEQAELPVVKDAKVIKIQFPEEVLYFALTDLTETDLAMIYLTGNGTLRFTRI